MLSKPRYAENNEKDFNFVKECWKVCFGDSQKFIDWNFKYNYSPKNTIIADNDSTPMAAMQCIPYILKFKGKEYPASYFSGVGTLPQFRGNGCAMEMLKFALSNKFKDNICIPFLISAADSLYLKAGFKKIGERHIYRSESLYDNFKNHNIINTMPDTEAELLALIDKLSIVYNRHTYNTLSVKRDFFKWKLYLTELIEISGGCIILTDNGYLAAYPFEDKNNTLNNKAEIYECCGIDPKENNFTLLKKEPVMAYIPIKYSVILDEIPVFIGCIL